jgi:uncharacterized protein YcaQ
VLPILFRDRLVGRIEPRIDRAAGVVQVLGLWWEDGFRPCAADGFVDAMRAALRAYLAFARDASSGHAGSAVSSRDVWVGASKNGGRP